MPTRRTLTWLGLITLTALILDIVFFSGYYASDDVSYTWAARHLALGDDLGTNSIAQLRLAINIPSGLVYWIGGGDVTWIAWSFVLYHLALVGVAFAIGNMFHGTRVGLIAAALAATSPLFYVFAGAILPDLATAVWLGLFLIALERARRRSRANRSSARVIARDYIAAGVCLGVAYSCKESGVIMTVPAAACVIAAAPRLLSGRWVRDGVLLALGLVAFILVEIALLRLLAGEWIFRLSIETDPGIYLQKMGAQGGASPIDRFKFAMFTRLEPVIPLSMWLLPVAAIGYTFLRDRSLALITFFWWPLVFLTIGTTSLSQYEPPTIHARYYAIVVIPAVVMTARVAEALWERYLAWSRRPAWLPRRLAALLLITVLTTVSVREVAINLPTAGTLYRSTDARGFSRAYELARDKYPQYPIVLAPFFRRRMTQLLFPSTPEGVYADSSLTKTPLPEPPFLLLESAWSPEGLAPLGFDPSTLRIRTIESITPPARRIDVFWSGLWRAFGTTPRDPVPQARRGVTLIQLVELRSSEPARIATVPPPVLPLSSRGKPPPTTLWITTDGDGHLVTWTDAASFHLQRFDHDSLRKPPRMLEGQLETPTRRLRLTTELVGVRGDPVNIMLHAYGYDETEMIAKAQAQVRLRRGPTTLALEIVSDAPMTSFKIRMKVDPRPGKQRAPRSTFRIGPTTAVDASSLAPLPDPPAAWHPLGDGADVLDNRLIWDKRDAHMIQYFDRLALAASPRLAASRIDPPSARLAVEVDLTMAAGTADALVYVYGYAGGKQVGKAYAKLGVGPETTTARVDVTGEEPMDHYRVRAQITPAGKGAGELMLGRPRASTAP